MESVPNDGSLLYKYSSCRYKYQEQYRGPRLIDTDARVTAPSPPLTEDWSLLSVRHTLLYNMSSPYICVDTAHVSILDRLFVGPISNLYTENVSIILEFPHPPDPIQM